MTLEQVVSAGLALPDEERMELVELLIASLEQTGCPPIDDAPLDEVWRRSADFDAGKVKPMPWETVKQRDQP